MTANELKSLLVQSTDCNDIKTIILENWHLKSTTLKEFSINVSYREKLDMGPGMPTGPNFYGSINAVFNKAVSEIDLKTLLEKIGINLICVTWAEERETHDEGKVGRPKKTHGYIAVVYLDSDLWRGLSAQYMYSVLKNGVEKSEG